MDVYQQDQLEEIRSFPSAAQPKFLVEFLSVRSYHSYNTYVSLEPANDMSEVAVIPSLQDDSGGKKRKRTGKDRKQAKILAEQVSFRTPAIC